MVFVLILFYIGLGLVNLSWITFLLLLGAKIFNIMNYAWFSITKLSIIGTPLLLLVIGFSLMFLSYIITKMKGYK